LIELIVKSIASYLLGSLMGSLVLGRLRGGVDIRTLGSGNAGGTNALRTQGRLFALGVIVIDIGKGFIATRVVAPLDIPNLASTPFIVRDWLPAICGIAAIVGHVYPAWFGFRGGKGVATFVGALVGIAAWLLVPVLITWLIVVMLSGYVGLASIVAAISFPIYIAQAQYQPYVPLLVFGMFAAALIVITHRANIERMKAGVEPHARRLWLLRRGRG
jgi:acyl phosphate:glycerol-3-phosphate acyltransferase